MRSIKFCRHVIAALPFVILFSAILIGLRPVNARDLQISGKVVVAVRADAPPFSFEDEESCPKKRERGLDELGPYCGYIAEFCARLLTDAKIPWEVRELPAKAWLNDDSLKAFDLFCGPTSITKSRLELVDFSSVLFPAGTSYVYTSAPSSRVDGSTGEKKGIIGFLDGTTSQHLAEELRSRHWFQDLGDDPNLEEFTSHDLGVEAVCTGRIDVYIGDRDILSAEIEKISAKIGGCAANVSKSYFTYEAYGLAFGKRNTALSQALQAVVQESIYRLQGQNYFGLRFEAYWPDGTASNLLESLWRLNTIEQAFYNKR